MIATAGVVRTGSSSASGRIALADGKVVAGGKAFDSADVRIAVVNPEGRTLPQPHCLRLASGETIRGRIAACDDGKVTFHRWGVHRIDRALVQSLDFVPAPPANASQPRTLYRAGLPPLPGAVLWIDATRVAVDGPLGVMTVPRAGTQRCVFSRPASRPLPMGLDEIVLVDGSVLRGKAVPAAGALKLTHAALGELTLPAGMIRTIRRNPAGVTYLADLAPIAETTPLTSGKPDARLTSAPAGADEAKLGVAACIRIEADTKATYRLTNFTGGRFRATIAPAGDSRGPVKLRITSSGKILLDTTLAAGDGPTDVDVAAPDGRELTIHTAFAGRVRPPCAVLLGDARLVKQ